MILSLRHRHRHTFTVLGLFLPVAFAVGIAARRTVPAPGPLPPPLSPGTQAFAPVDQSFDLFAKSPVRVRLWRDQENGRLAVGFMAKGNFIKPDLMAYWSAESPTTPDTLPSQASLLGAFNAGPLVLPAEASATNGCLILFSLADQEIVDVSKPTRFTDSMKQPFN